MLQFSVWPDAALQLVCTVPLETVVLNARCDMMEGVINGLCCGWIWKTATAWLKTVAMFSGGSGLEDGDPSYCYHKDMCVHSLQCWPSSQSGDMFALRHYVEEDM